MKDVPAFYNLIEKTQVLKSPFKQFVYNFYPQNKYLIFESIFTKMVKCKPDIMPINVFLSILSKVGAS